MEPKAAKQRKPQSDAEYAAQREQFQTTGPLVNTDDWLINLFELGSLDSSLKPDQTIMFQACELAYFRRDYVKCLDMIQRIELVVDELMATDVGKYTKLKKLIAELDIIKSRCKERLEGQNTGEEGQNTGEEGQNTGEEGQNAEEVA